MDRLRSHYKFAKDAFILIEKIRPDLLYVLIPPNSLAKMAMEYKKKHKSVKLIFDIIDLWPETMPMGKIKRLPLFTAWANMRNKSLKYTDAIITECELYNKVLHDSLGEIHSQTIYWAKHDLHIVDGQQLSQEEFRLAYLGSINNIIDIERIKQISQVFMEIKPVV